MSTTSKNYRPWLANEDDKLVEALMNMVNTGAYRADKGFKSGYLQHLESVLKESLPGAGILAKPHIESRMRTLKKNFAVVFDMLNSSGFGYDKELKTITVTSRGVWDDYIASHPKADKWKNKRLPHYEELCVIFGKDRAQGNRAKVPSQMEDDVNMEEQDQQIDDGFDDELEGSHSATRHSNMNLEDTSSSRSKKRKASSQLTNLVESLTDAGASFGDSLCFTISMETIAGGSSELPVRLAVVINGHRASKKLITDTEDKELPSSGDVVLSNDDLLILILLRSPTISIIQWKTVSKRWLSLITTVSKRWLSLITTPTFALHRGQIPIDPPFGLFLRRHTKFSFEYDFVPLNIRSPPNFNFTLGPAAGNVEILQSCNGLLLCCITSAPAPDEMLYVCNPSLNLFKMLPKQNYHSNLRHKPASRSESESDNTFGGIIMAFDPNKSPHYKVIRSTGIESGIQSDDGFFLIQTYSSETSNWIDCGVHSQKRRYFRGFSSGIYWNDAIFWLCTWDEVSHLSLNGQRPVLRTIKTPNGQLYHSRNKLFESRGRLLLVCDTHDITPNVYEMRNCEWRWMYRVDVGLLTGKKWPCFCVQAIVLGETEGESFIVIETNGRTWKYNLGLKTHSDLFHLEPTRFNREPSDSSFDGFLFIASFAGV